MVVSDLIAAAYLKATGKISTLTSSDAKWVKLLAIANAQKNNWANEPGVDWVSLYSPTVSCGTVTATDTFDLDSSIHKISQEWGDPIRITHNDGNYTDYDLISPDQLKHYSTGNYVAKVGSTLKFNKAFTATDPQFGGTIDVPAYTVPADLVNSDDTIPVDDPNWLVVMTAAEFVRTDLTRQNQYPNLVAEANQLLQKMIENNEPQVTTIILGRVGGGRTW